MKVEVVAIQKGNRVIVMDGVGRKTSVNTDMELTVGDTVSIISGVIVSKANPEEDKVFNV